VKINSVLRFEWTYESGEKKYFLVISDGNRPLYRQAYICMRKVGLNIFQANVGGTAEIYIF